jgi:hypothetical protein
VTTDDTAVPSVQLPPLPNPVSELWHDLLTLAEEATVPWTLIGGQMVLLHALEHGRVPPQISQDGDVVADVRADPRGLAALAATLENSGFNLAGISTDGIAHRYKRRSVHDDTRPVVIDILAPDGLGERTDLTTTPPGRTVQVPGGTQALNRTELCRVEHESRAGHVPRPTLVGAIIGKAAACGLGGNTDRHYRDLALLCALLDDPFTAADDLTPGDRRKLRLATGLTDSRHAAWSLVPDDIRADGQDSFALLFG